MIEDIPRCVVQRVQFTSHQQYVRHGAGEHGEMRAHEESLTPDGVYEAVGRMGLRVGEIVAVWAIPPDDHREGYLIEVDLPPVPSALLVRTADKKLLELNPAYLTIHDRPDDFG
ncbi:hypothetical protein ABT282_08575 [Streptomyces sp. NPDC000927]|uniref:hypothetical protein n=1 Tax=Streptomyces sp. NPDC000927 TaxID=3154371 RepID=UPI003319A462